MGNFRIHFYLLFVFLNVLSFVLSQTCLEGERVKKFNDRLLKDHNEYRSRHGTPPLKLDTKAIEDATNWSKQLTLENGLRHSGAGENLYRDSSTSIVESELDPVKMWYDEINLYTKPEFSMQTGHFTQVVWRDSRKLGCGVCSSSKGTVVTCRYSPPGNVLGQFEENVPPMKSESGQNENGGSSSVQPTTGDDASSETVSLEDDVGYTTRDMEDEETTSVGTDEGTSATTYKLTSDSSDFEKTTLFGRRTTPTATPQPDELDENMIEILLFTLAIIVLILSLLPLGILLKYMYNQFTSCSRR